MMSDKIFDINKINEMNKEQCGSYDLYIARSLMFKEMLISNIDVITNDDFRDLFMFLHKEIRKRGISLKENKVE